MASVRPSTSARPRLLVDPNGASVADPTNTRVGRGGPLGRQRMVFALPLNPGPALLRAPLSGLRAQAPVDVADPNLILVGREPVWVARMLVALPTEDTRRLA